MAFRALDPVVLARDLPDHGLKTGDLGAIVHVHGGARFEVEFVRASGQTQAVLTLGTAELRRVDKRDLVAVRTVV